MAAGGDKVIAFDPPGAIGLIDGSPIVLLRFDEEEDAIPPKDAAGNLEDLVIVGTAADISLPAVVDGALGRARHFAPGDQTGLLANDIESGSTLLTRDISIQVVLRWDAATQENYGGPGCIVARGNDSGPASQYVAYGIQIESTGGAQGAIRWFWMDTAGVLAVQSAADFHNPDGFTMFTATRRWVSPSEVVLRYYIGDVLIGEFISADGDIGGGTTGIMQFGHRFDSGPTDYLAGDLDELMILDRELTIEEIEATWLRITQYQPLAHQLFTELHDPGFPLPPKPSSDVQLETRMIGHALGLAAAAAENMRANMLPGRAYGQVLEDWETATRPNRAPPQDIDTRRARVVARMRQRRGVSIGGLQDALIDLLGGGTPEELEFFAFDNTVRDSFETIEPERWRVDPPGAVTAVSGAASFQPGAGTFLAEHSGRSWVTMKTTVSGRRDHGARAHILVKLVFTTAPANSEAGVYFGHTTNGDYLLLGMRNNAGSFEVVAQSFHLNIAAAQVVLATPGTNPAAIWLHLRQTATAGQWIASWSTTSATAGFTDSAPITHPAVALWSGCYLRSTAAIAAPRADFDDLSLRTRLGTRPFHAYVMLDRTLGHDPDIIGAQSAVRAIRHAYTHATFITSRSLLCDDEQSGCDLGPMGAL